MTNSCINYYMGYLGCTMICKLKFSVISTMPWLIADNFLTANYFVWKLFFCCCFVLCFLQFVPQYEEHFISEWLLKHLSSFHKNGTFCLGGRDMNRKSGTLCVLWFLWLTDEVWNVSPSRLLLFHLQRFHWVCSHNFLFIFM